MGSGEGVNEPVYMWITSHARAPVRPRMPSHPMPVACRSCSLRHLLLTFRHPVTVGFRRRATGERRVRSLLVVEPDPLCDHPLRHEARSCRYTASYFRERHSRSMNTLSIHRPRSIEQRIPAVSSNPVNAILVNWLP